jgi:hypothetical protein
MNNQFFEENSIFLNNIKEILKSKDIILYENFLNAQVYLSDNKIKIFENIFESQKLIECNENLFDEENYFIKANSLIYHYETENSNENYNGAKNIKKAKKKQDKSKIFWIEKIDKKKKNMGRRKKEKKYKTKASHNKFNKDNIVRKIKIHFLNAGIKYINKKYNEFQKLRLKRTKQKFLQKLEKKYTDYLTKKEEKIFLSKKLNEILSDTVSKRCKNHNKDYNKKNIKKLINNGEPKNLIEFLDKTIEDVYKIYISKEKDKIPEFNLENDLTLIEEDINEKGENYKIKYKEYALDLISILNEPGKIK